GRRLEPVAVGRGGVRPFGQPALAADRPADPAHFLAEGLAAVGELVERPAQVGAEPLAADGQADVEAPVASGLERLEELDELLSRDGAVVLPGAVPGGASVRLRGRGAAARAGLAGVLDLVSDSHRRPLDRVPADRALEPARKRRESGFRAAILPKSGLIVGQPAYRGNT